MSFLNAYSARVMLEISKAMERPRKEIARPPFGEIPGSVGVDVLLGASGAAAVYISRLASYSDGLLFDMLVVDRAANLTRDQLLAVGDPEPTLRSPSQVTERASLELMVEYVDGRRVSTRWSAQSDGGLEGSLTKLRAENGRRLYPYCRYEWYLSPLPESGDLTFVCDWPALGINGSRATTSGHRIRAAALRAHNAWDAVRRDESRDPATSV